MAAAVMMVVELIEMVNQVVQAAVLLGMGLLELEQVVKEIMVV